MTDPIDIAAENIAQSTIDVKTLRQSIYERLVAFAAFAEYEFFNYIGSDTVESIVSGIVEIQAAKSIVISYDGSTYAYEPMAKREMNVIIAIRNTRLYTKDFTIDPLSDAIKAVIRALDKWTPGGHCRVKVVGDDTIDCSQAMSAAVVRLTIEDQ